jgi:hypothetical protein
MYLLLVVFTPNLVRCILYQLNPLFDVFSISLFTYCTSKFLPVGASSVTSHSSSVQYRPPAVLHAGLALYDYVSLEKETTHIHVVLNMDEIRYLSLMILRALLYI